MKKQVGKIILCLLTITMVFVNFTLSTKATDYDLSQYISQVALEYEKDGSYIAYDQSALADQTKLRFNIRAALPKSSLDVNHSIRLTMPDHLALEDTVAPVSAIYSYAGESHDYSRDGPIGSYTVKDHQITVTINNPQDDTLNVYLQINTTLNQLTFTNNEVTLAFSAPSTTITIKKATETTEAQTNETQTTPKTVKRAPLKANSNTGAPKEIKDNINESVKTGLSGSYKLIGTTTVDQGIGDNRAININNDVTIDLNGQKLQVNNGLYFDIQKDAHLTILDSKANNYQPVEKETTEDIGNISVVDKSAQNDPVKLKYYVTEAVANNTTTTDTTKQYEVDLSNAGRIYSRTEKEANQDSTFMIEKGGTLDFEGGVAYNDNGSHVVATKGDGNGTATLNLSGGYLIGNRSSNVIWNNAGNVLNISGGVITNGYAENGGGIYNNAADNSVTGGGTINMTGGIITGNEAYTDGNDSTATRYSGGGIYMKSGTLKISGDAYITNNRKTLGASSGTHFSLHGGGGVAADNDSQVNMSGGYVTGNYSHEAGAGLYIGYYDNGGGITQLIMTGGTVASNVTETGEGGGIRIGGKARGNIRADKDSKIYITNNKTNTGKDTVGTGDWGGGGIFVQTKGMLNVMNSVITKNHADGFGGGVSACPTGSTNIVRDEGAAIYSNTASGTHYSRGSGNGNEHKNEDYAAYKWKENNVGIAEYRDYFLAHPANDRSYYSFGNEMLGGGSQNWRGTFQEGKAKEQNYNVDGISANFLMLTAGPTDADINKALGSATTFISGNYSGNHGGGIMTNGNLSLGMTKDNYPMITLKSYKSLFVQNGTDQETQKPISEGRFDFSIYRHEGESTALPVWNGNKFTDGSGVNKLINQTSNDASTDQVKAALIQFPVYKINDNGTYVYYIVENKDKDSTMEYDSTIYEVDLTVADHGQTKIGSIETTQHSIKSYQVYKISGPSRRELLSSANNFPFDDSKTDNAITIGSSNNNTAFTNTKHNYNITITKTDSENESKVLSDAKFKLYKLDDNNADASISTIDLTDLGEQTSNADGEISYSGLISGSKYYLVEEEAPEGYNKNGPWIIDMATSGLKIYQADCQLTNVNNKPQLIRNSNKSFVTGDGTEIKNFETYEITTFVTDEVIKYTMPNTGGMGTYIYYQVGFLLLTLVNIVWIIKRRVA